MGIGIYMIKNMSNNKVYIGQSTNIDKRLNAHKYKLNKNKHENSHLQNSYNKYGSDMFVFTKICECDKSELNEKERFYIKKYKSYISNYGFNLTKGGDSKIEFSSETIDKMRMSHEYEFISIIQYTKNKELINKYNSISEASRSVNGTPSGVRNCANKFSYGIGSSKTYKGFIWIYEFDKETFEGCDIEKYLHKKVSIPINKYKYPSGEFVCGYETVSLAAKDNNVSNDVISLCVRGAQKQSGGFTYRNADKFPSSNIQINVAVRKKRKQKSIVGLDPNTHSRVMFFSSINEIQENGFHIGHIYECCNGKRKMYRGLVWEFADEQFEKYFCEDGIRKVETKSLADM